MAINEISSAVLRRIITLQIDRVYQALTLLNQMRAVGVKPDSITFNTLLHLCDRAEQGYCALSLYQVCPAIFNFLPHASHSTLPYPSSPFVEPSFLQLLEFKQN